MRAVGSGLEAEGDAAGGGGAGTDRPVAGVPVAGADHAAGVEATAGGE
jgi:hypothetical protein